MKLKFLMPNLFSIFLKLDEPHRLSYPLPEQVTCHACVGVVSHVCVTYWVVCLVHGEVLWGARPSLASCWSRCGRWWHTAVFELSLSVIQHPHRNRLVSSLLLSVNGMMHFQRLLSVFVLVDFALCRNGLALRTPEKSKMASQRLAQFCPDPCALQKEGWRLPFARTGVVTSRSLCM